MNDFRQALLNLVEYNGQMPTFSIFLIDPKARSIASVESAGTTAHLRQLVKTDYLLTTHLNEYGDILAYAYEAAEEHDTFCLDGKFNIQGKAIVLGAIDGELKNPRINLQYLRFRIKFPEI